MSLFGKMFGGSNPEKDLACSGCGHLWSAAPDGDGLFNGYGCPPCPICGEPSVDANDYRDYTCDCCGHQWRQYGNGGLVYGCVPRCPECGN